MPNGSRIPTMREWESEEQPRRDGRPCALAYVPCVSNSFLEGQPVYDNILINYAARLAEAIRRK